MVTDEERIDPENRRVAGSLNCTVRAVATGLFGSIVISIFLQNFIQGHILAALLPVIMAFNAAVAGFTLVRLRLAGGKTESEQDTTTRLMAAVVGGLSVLLSLGALSLMGIDALAGEFFDVVLLVVACLGGLVCGPLGAWIATRHAELSESKA